METETPDDRWAATDAYISEVFAVEPAELAAHRRDADAAGLPTISVGPTAGRFLTLLAALLRDGEGARSIVEVGMLGGYSALCLALGLAPDGSLLTIEPEADRVEFARERFAAVGESRIEVRQGEGIPVLDALLEERGEESVDLVFLDAIKTEYLEYYARARRLVRPGGVIAADNVLGTGGYWITEAEGLSEKRDAVDRFNRTVAADPDFIAMPVPLRQGLLVALKKRH